MTTTKKVCPGCGAALIRVVDVAGWVCVRPCGFRSSSDDPTALLLLAGLWKLTIAIEDFAVRADAALSSSNITQDLETLRRG